MKIAILGTGQVALIFAKGMVKHKHQVKIGTRDPSKPNEAIAALAKETNTPVDQLLVTSAQAAEFAEVVFLCLSWKGVEPVCMAIQSHVDNKVVIDVTNPAKEAGNFYAEMERLPTSGGGGECVQKWLPKAHVVKSWNTVGMAMFIDPITEDGKRPVMFICGNQDAAKATVGEILKSVGWDHMDLGNIQHAGYLEHLCTLWCSVAFKTGNFNWAVSIQKGK